MNTNEIMALVNRYAEACDDLGAGLFGQTEAQTAGLHAKAKALYEQIEVAVASADDAADQCERLRAALGRIERTAALPTAHAIANVALRGLDCASDRNPEGADAHARDAERYRWLRRQQWWKAEIACVMAPKEAVKLGHDCPSLERLDDAIDAARGIVSPEGIETRSGSTAKPQEPGAREGTRPEPQGPQEGTQP